MAISNILPRKTMRNRTRLQSMTERHDYDQKAEKTRDGELVSSYMCSPETAAKEFEESKQLYHQLTGRKQPPKRDVIMYRVIQSFKPGEVSPEEANRIGYELAMKFTGGQHQFVVSTHVDKKHIHTHIEFNSTNLNCDGKFVNPLNSYLILRRLNDDLCRAHGLSVIEHPKERTKPEGEAAAIIAIFKKTNNKRKRQTNAGNPAAKQNRVPYEPRQGAGPDFGPSIHEGGPSSWTTSSQWDSDRDCRAEGTELSSPFPPGPPGQPLHGESAYCPSQQCLRA